MSRRPALALGLDPEVFLDHYWLRSELAQFCRKTGLSSTGSKVDLTNRIAAMLGRKEIPPSTHKPRNGKMPDHLTLDSVIGSGWRCSAAMRAVLAEHFGQQVRFDARLRELIHEGEGRTVREIAAQWQEAEKDPPQEIAAQFEYNRFVRAYRQANAGASHREVVAAWHEHRAVPRSQRLLEP